MDIMNLMPVFIVMAIAVTVIFTELVKKLDKKDRLKGYRVYIPMALSFGAACCSGSAAFSPPGRCGSGGR